MQDDEQDGSMFGNRARRYKAIPGPIVVDLHARMIVYLYMSRHDRKLKQCSGAAGGQIRTTDPLRGH